jgi:valyl-tRNA synthetase
MRIELRLEPKADLEVNVQVKNHGPSFQACVPIIARLGRATKVEISEVEDFAAFERDATVFLDDTFILTINLAKAGLQAEYERLSKQLQEAREYSAKLNQRLQNESFMQKAKPEILETTRKDAVKTSASISDLEKRMTFLAGKL